MAKAKEIAAALRDFADHIEKEPEAELGYFFLSKSFLDKESILTMGRVMPRPVEKSYGNDNIDLTYKYTDGSGSKWNENIVLWTYFQAPRTTVCERVVVDKKLVPAIVIPATPETVIPATEEKTIPEHEEEVVQWKCHSLLSDTEEAAL